MGFTEAISVCLSKFANFNGRASRSEFWWFYLFTIIVGNALGLINDFLMLLSNLILLLPVVAAVTRRLHDINKSGWLQLWWTLGLIVIAALLGFSFAMMKHSGSTLLMAVAVLLLLAAIGVGIYYLAKPGDAGDNQYGPPPAN